MKPKRKGGGAWQPRHPNAPLRQIDGWCAACQMAFSRKACLKGLGGKLMCPQCGALVAPASKIAPADPPHRDDEASP